MMFLLEEIAVETAMIVATLVAAACLIGVLIGFGREHRALRTAQVSDSGRRDNGVQFAERAGQLTSFTPSHN